MPFYSPYFFALRPVKYYRGFYGEMAKDRIREACRRRGRRAVFLG